MKVYKSVQSLSVCVVQQKRCFGVFDGSWIRSMLDLVEIVRQKNVWCFCSKMLATLVSPTTTQF